MYLTAYRPETNTLSTYVTNENLLLGDSVLVSMARSANIGTPLVVHEQVLFDVPIWMNNALVCFLTCCFYVKGSFPNKYALADIYRFSCKYAAFCEAILTGGKLDVLYDFFAPFSD